MVRGLALRSLCNIRWDTIVEYAQKPLHRGMTDVSPYVRKTAVTSILKVIISHCDLKLIVLISYIFIFTVINYFLLDHS